MVGDLPHLKEMFSILVLRWQLWYQVTQLKIEKEMVCLQYCLD